MSHVTHVRIAAVQPLLQHKIITMNSHVTRTIVTCPCHAYEYDMTQLRDMAWLRHVTRINVS